MYDLLLRWLRCAYSASIAFGPYKPCATGFCLIDLCIEGQFYSKDKWLKTIEELWADVVFKH